MRKVWSSLVVIVLATALLWFGKIDGDQFVKIVEMIAIAFGLANGAEHVSRGMKGER